MIFADPAELLCLYDPNFRELRYKMHPWQLRILRSFARKPPEEELLRIALIAANGSGKSQFVLAPCAVWHAMNFPSSQTVITTASAQQLDKQPGRFIKMLAGMVNTFHKETLGEDPPWEIKYRQLVYKHGQPDCSYIDLFATDEKGQAEGWHPIVPGGSFAIFVDEAKTVSEDIYEALARCNGCVRRLDISSPGPCDGHFYQVCTRPELNWEVHKVTAFQCPHIRAAEIQEQILKHGPNDPLVRSSIFAEFTSTGETIVITTEILNECVRIYKDGQRQRAFGLRRAGLDLSAGGDETVLSVWDGTQQIGQECFRFKDTVAGAMHIIELIRKWKLDPAQVIADDGGIGRGIIDNLRSRGYDVTRVLNGAQPHDRTRYANRGTEIYFHLKRFVEDGDVGFLPDEHLKRQLTTRYFKYQAGGRIMLEPKPEARLKGRPSPDRADACALAWSNVEYPVTSNIIVALPQSRCTGKELAEKVRRDAVSVLFPELNEPAPSKEYVLQRDFLKKLKDNPLWTQLRSKNKLLK